MAEKGARSEVVRGRRVETVEYGLRTPADTYFHRKWYVEPMSSLERAVECRDRPYTGRRGDEVPVSRVIVTYTTDWAPVPGVEAGTLHLSCNHGGTPKGYVGDGNFGLGSQGTEYQMPHPYRVADMIVGEDGKLRYTCPVCGLTWRLRDDGPDKPAENMPADIPPDEPLLTLF